MFDLTLVQYLINFWMVPVIVLLSPFGVMPFTSVSLGDMLRLSVPAFFVLAVIAHVSALIGL